jgi:pyruvate kinase
LFSKRIDLYVLSVLSYNSRMYIKKTKIIATIGPASFDRKILKKMIQAGMNVARLNFSHGTYDWHAEAIKNIREISKELKTEVGIMADLQGPRIRVGNDKEFKVEPGEIVLINDKKTAGGKKELVIDSPGVGAALRIGEWILIEDGLIEFRVVKKNGKTAVARVISGGIIKPRKGINIPDTKLHFGAVTKKDEADLKFSLAQNVDFVALSFVSNGAEIADLREQMKRILKRDKILPQIISKIERKEALKNLDEIIEASDAVMVARGDLGIEMDESKVVIFQKEIIAKCLRSVRPVIVATQMLNSMIENPLPTRAEVADVSNAVIDHADATMLSGESANGKYPVGSVATMKNIIVNTEESPFDDIQPGFLDRDMLSDYAATIHSAHELAKSSNAKAIALFTSSGKTARMMSHHRPEQMILAVTNDQKVYNQLSLVWGADSYLVGAKENREIAVEKMLEQARKEKKLKSGDKVVVIVGKAVRNKAVKLVGLKEI